MPIIEVIPATLTTLQIIVMDCDIRRTLDLGNMEITRTVEIDAEIRTQIDLELEI